MRPLSALLSLFAAFMTCMVSGCASSSESAETQKLTAQVGVYSPPPPGIERARAGVPPFESIGQGSSAQVNEIAADQLTTLAVNSDRFDVIERTQLDQLLKEQGLEGIVKAEELAKQGQVRGVDYLILGKVSNLRVKAEKASRGFGLGRIPIPGAGNLGAFDYTRKDSTITAECGVDLRLVEATSGRVAEAQSSDYKRTDTIGAFGIDILGASAGADADLQIDEDNKGAILRLALDEAFRKMLPKIDRALQARARETRKAGAAAAAAAAPPPSDPATTAPAGGAVPAGGAAAAPAGAAPTESPAAAKKFCAGCGTPLAAGAKFCPGCGTKVDA